MAVEVSLPMVLTIHFGMVVRAMTGKYTINYFQYQEDVGCVCMLNDWISSNDEICPDNYNYFLFKLQGKGRSEKWQIYLYGDQTMEVQRDGAEVLSRGAPPPGIGGVGFGPSPNLATDPHHLVVSAIRAWHGNEHEFGGPRVGGELQRDVRVHGSSCGTQRGVVHCPPLMKHNLC